MRPITAPIVWALVAALAAPFGVAAAGTGLGDAVSGSVEIVRYESERSQARIEPARLGDRPGLAVVFQGTDDLHYYASEKTAPAPGLQLKVEARSDNLAFEPAIYPSWGTLNDPAIGNIDVYVGDFTVFVPLRQDSIRDTGDRSAAVEVRIAGIACTSRLCLPPFEKTLTTSVDLDRIGSWGQIAPDAAQESPTATPEPGPQPDQAASTRGAAIYYLLAILAGLSINIMPCVLPVLPLVMMRLVQQANHSSRRRIQSGLAFCAGVVFFFAAFAALSAIINLTTGAVLDLNSLFRYPSAVIALFLAIVFFGLAMLDVVTLSLPSSITGGQGAAYQAAGSAGMGFFAAILSTPCSGALLGFVLVWAQTQPLLVSSAAIVLMGVGMALPYAVVVLVPSLLDRLPRPGYWMDIFKKSAGFLLFFLAVKLTLAALPKERLLNVLTYGVIFSFCVWMWSKWTGLAAFASRPWAFRLVTLGIVVGAGLWLLPAPGFSAQTPVDWQPYDAARVQQTLAQDRPVLLKFTADWCTNCKVVERRVYHDSQVVRLVEQKNVLSIKADTTLIDYPATKDFKQVYGEAGNVPVTILLLPDGSRHKLRGIFDKSELIDLLNGIR